MVHPKDPTLKATQFSHTCIHSFIPNNHCIDKPFLSLAGFQIQSKMGLLWWKSKGKSEKKPNQKPDPKATEVPGMNGAVEVPRRPPSDVAVFEFGSVANSADKVTVAGYCPVSDELEPCRWEILPSEGPDAPQFRIVF
uniref:Uncharacterized protein n=1 Tax=Opuntia streptacantha TaxID=393608 RepID=A0A7C9CZW5_OPUST